jgi:ribosomal protein L37AE/L43A
MNEENAETNEVVTTDPEPETPKPPQIQVVKVSSLINPWSCQKCGWVLGTARAETVNGKKTRFLVKFPFAFDPTAEIPVSMFCSKIFSGIIACTNCGHPRTWAAGSTVKPKGR